MAVAQTLPMISSQNCLNGRNLAVRKPDGHGCAGSRYRLTNGSPSPVRGLRQPWATAVVTGTSRLVLSASRCISIAVRSLGEQHCAVGQFAASFA